MSYLNYLKKIQKIILSCLHLRFGINLFLKINLNSITHLKTEFKSTLKSKIDPFDIIHNLHPTPAVCGTPKKAAMEIIRKLESHNRGWYSGTLGWIDNNYNFPQNCTLVTNCLVWTVIYIGLI